MWGAGSSEDYAATVAKTGEPVITSMALEGEGNTFEWTTPPQPLSAYGLWQVQKRRAEIRKEHLDLWESTVNLTGTGRPVDAIISPVAPYASAPHGKNMYVPVTAPYKVVPPRLDRYIETCFLPTAMRTIRWCGTV